MLLGNAALVDKIFLKWDLGIFGETMQVIYNLGPKEIGSALLLEQGGVLTNIQGPTFLNRKVLTQCLMVAGDDDFDHSYITELRQDPAVFLLKHIYNITGANLSPVRI